MKVTIPVTVDGFHCTIEYENADINYTAENGDWLGEITDTLKAHNYDPYRPPAPAAAAARQAAPATAASTGYGTNGRYSNGNGNGGGGNGYGNRSNAGGGWACPVHGDESIGAGFNGSGQECKVKTGNPEADDPNMEWIRLDEDGNPKADRNGNFWCRHKSNSGQRRGNGGGYGNRGGYR